MDRTSAISVGAILGGQNGEDHFIPYMYTLSFLIENSNTPSNEKLDLEILLIYFYVKGPLDWFKMPEKEKLGRYSTKEKSIEYSVPITDENFFSRNDRERKELLVQVTHNALNACEKRFKEKGLHADFPNLRNALEAAAAQYMETDCSKKIYLVDDAFCGRN